MLSADTAKQVKAKQVKPICSRMDCQPEGFPQPLVDTGTAARAGNINTGTGTGKVRRCGTAQVGIIGRRGQAMGGSSPGGGRFCVG